MLLFIVDVQQQIALMLFILFWQFFQTTTNSNITGWLQSRVPKSLWRPTSNHQQAKYVLLINLCLTSGFVEIIMERLHCTF